MTHRPRRPIEGPTNDIPYTGPVSADPSVGQNFHWPTDAENWPAREILYTWLRAEWIAHQCVTSRYRAIETMICDTRKMSRSEVEAYIDQALAAEIGYAPFDMPTDVRWREFFTDLYGGDDQIELVKRAIEDS